MTPIIQTNREWLQQEASDAARRVGIVDWLMLLLALLSVGLLAWEVFADPPQHISEMIFTAD